MQDLLLVLITFILFALCFVIIQFFDTLSRGK